MNDDIIYQQASKLLSGVALTFALVNSANATPVDWTADLSFQSGGSRAPDTVTLKGTLTYDADTNTTSNVNMVLNSGNGGTITDIITKAYSGGSSLYTIDVGDTKLVATGGNLRFVFNFDSSILTNAGGVLNLTSGGTTINNLLNPRNFSGTLTGVPQATAVPEPEAYAMMLAGLGLVGFAARRQQKAA